MVDLSELLGGGETATGPQREFFIFHDHHWQPTNGGCCKLWYPPAGTQYVHFEIISGGGPGGGASAGDWGPGGSGGNYASKSVYASGICTCGGVNFNRSTFTCTAGTTRPYVSNNASCAVSPNIDTGNAGYTLCAAGTSQCSCCLCCEDHPCRHGCSSYVNGPGLSNFCVTGGGGGSHFCDTRCSCYNCYIPGQCCHNRWSAGWTRVMCNCGFGYDQFFSGTAGQVIKGYSCNSDMTTAPGVPTGPFQVPSEYGGNYCTCNMACCHGHSLWPGGGGHPFQDDDICGYGSWGAGGMVKVTYQ